MKRKCDQLTTDSSVHDEVDDQGYKYGCTEVVYKVFVGL